MTNRSNEKEKRTKIETKDVSSSESGDVEESETSSAESSHSEESSPPHSPAHRRGPLRCRPRFLTRRFYIHCCIYKIFIFINATFIYIYCNIYLYSNMYIIL